MTDLDLQTIWLDAKDNPTQSAILALLVNGIPLDDLHNISPDQLDLDRGWFESSSGNAYPLSTQSIEALEQVDLSEQVVWQSTIDDLHDRYPSIESEAQRLLSGALWVTDQDLQLTLEFTGSIAAPILPLRYTFPFSITGQLQSDRDSSTAQEARDTLQRAIDWLHAELNHQPISLLQRFVNIFRQGSLVFLLASTGVNGLNLIHNVLMGRLLSPSDYSQLTFIITLQLLIGLFATVLQTVVARFSARYQAQSDETLLDALYTQGSRVGWIIGIGVAIVLIIASPVIVNLFQLNHIGIILPMLIFVPMFIKTGVDRGMLQGFDAYYWLTGSYVSEGVSRLVLSVILGYALLQFGRSLEGAVWGLAQSMLIMWAVGWLALRHLKLNPAPHNETAITQERTEWTMLARVTALALLGQMLITNSDFILVKNFFTPEDAGLYAAISVLGRIVYFGALPLTIMLVPMISRRQALNQSTRPILILLVGGGIAICSLLILLAAVFAPLVLGTLYGESYVVASGLLAPYALAASLYTLTNLVITYQLSLGGGREAFLPIVAGLAQLVLVFIFHESLMQVIFIQIVLMGILFVVVLWRVLRLEQDPTPPLTSASVAST